MGNSEDPLPPAVQPGEGRFSRRGVEALDAWPRPQERRRIQTCRELLGTLRQKRADPEDIPFGPTLGSGPRPWRKSEAQLLGAPGVGAVLAKQCRGERCVVGHTIKGRIASGQSPSRRLSLAPYMIAPAGIEMTEHCTCGSTLSPDDTHCPKCGRPLSAEQAARDEAEARDVEEARYLLETGPWEPNYSTAGVLVHTTMIPACMGVIVQNLVVVPTIWGALLSLCVSLGAGFTAVMLFCWKFPRFHYPGLVRSFGTITGFAMVLIGVALGGVSSRAEWPMETLVGAGSYLQELPITARLASWATPQWAANIVVLTAAVLLYICHAVAAMLGSIIAGAIFPGRTLRRS